MREIEKELFCNFLSSLHVYTDKKLSEYLVDNSVLKDKKDPMITFEKFFARNFFYL